MKAKILFICLLVLVALTSCGYSIKALSREATYKDPQSIGGYWTIYFDNGDVYENVICSYWGMEDDTSVWEKTDGTMLIQSGACHAVQVKMEVENE